MRNKKYTIGSTLGEILNEPACIDLLNKIAPEITDNQSISFIRDVSLQILIENASGKQAKLFSALLDVANGKEVDISQLDDKNDPPMVVAKGEITYNIDDIDGRMYMLEHRFSGCLVVRFTKEMDETVYGKVTCDGKELPKGIIKYINTARAQMFGIPVRDTLTEYDKVYTLRIEGFKDTDGNMMEPQEITVRTLPKTMPDPAYEQHDYIALEAAREGIVLLKNDNNVLPLHPDEEIWVEGINNFRLGAAGAGRINPRYRVDFKRGITEYSKFQISENAKTGIIVISRPSGENIDNNAIKGEFYLTDEEEKLIADLSRKYNKTVAIINSGYPMDLRWIEKYNINAVLWCGFPGMLGGKALVEILDGRINPSGKLSDTWSMDYFDIPTGANFYRPTDADSVLDSDSPYFIDTYYEEDIYVGYRYFETFNKPVAYPFGFGLSYTDFSIDAQFKDMKITVTVNNIGKVSGKEVVQVYAKLPDGKLEQPSKRLVGFVKTSLLSPEEEESFIIEITEDRLTSYDTEDAAWIMEEGTYEFFVGNSVKNLVKCGEITLQETKKVKQVDNLMSPPVPVDILSKKNPKFPEGLHSGLKENAKELTPKGSRKIYAEEEIIHDDFVSKLTVEELARLSVCASHGWGMQNTGEAGRIFRLDKYDMPEFVVADGNNGVNINKPNIGMPTSNLVCASWNKDLAYEVGRVIAEEAKENGINMILAPAMNIHRDPLNGRHPEYFSEDPYLAGVMAGYQSKGLEDHGVSSCIKHAVANNCESSRKRNHSIVSERALREIYLKVFEVAIGVHKPDSMMTAYNAVNGVFTAEDEEMIQGIFRKEFGFKGFVMTDWNSYDTADIVSAIQAGNCWMTPGSKDDTYVTPIVEGVKEGKIDLERLRSNVRYMLRVVQKRTGKNLGVK